MCKLHGSARFFVFDLPLFPEIVQSQCGGAAGALPFPHGGGHQDHGGDEEGQGLIELGGDLGQPAQGGGEGGGQAAAGHPQGAEKAEDEGAQNGHGRVPVGEDDQGHCDSR